MTAKPPADAAGQTISDPAPGMAPMTVWCADADAGAPVLDALAEGFALDVRADLPGPDSGVGNILLLYRSAPQTLCQAMADGASPGAALDAWRDQTRAILALNRRNRRRVQVMETAAAQRHPKAFRSHFGLPEGDGPAAVLRNDQADIFLMLLAQRLLFADPQSRTLLAELEAVSISLSGAAPPEDGDPDAAFLAYQSLRKAQDDADALRLENQRLEQEMAARDDQLLTRQHSVDLLQAQARAMQEELEGLARRQIELEQTASQVPALRRQNADKENSLRAADAMLRTLEGYRDALTADLTRTRRELAASRRDNSAKQAGIEQLETRLRDLESSRSYRLTAPLRRIRSLISGKGPA